MDLSTPVRPSAFNPLRLASFKQTQIQIELSRLFNNNNNNNNNNKF